MPESATLAAIRFGYGLGPRAPAASAPALLASLDPTDPIARRFPFQGDLLAETSVFIETTKQAQRNAPGAEEARQASLKRLRAMINRNFLTDLARIAETPSPFFERLCWFWADHFTATGKNPPGNVRAFTYVDEAIRPHVTGRFADMLRAVATHPQMLIYLDQTVSFGPHSVVGKRPGRGLNENLAREMLELHTLGVDAAYTQTDVRALALLLTGLALSPDRSFAFRPEFAEPGVITVLGRSYGGTPPRLEDVDAVLEALAVHPATSRHLARKMAVHFVADTPDPDLVAHMAQAYRQSGGALRALYEAMLEHPAAWAGFGGKIKPPFDYMASAFVAVGVPGAQILATEDKPRAILQAFLIRMGQPFRNPPGPDGWPEEADNWITSQGLAARITWATRMAHVWRSEIGDPRAFLNRSLADAAGPQLTWAVSAADTHALGATLVLASPEFNRR